MEIEAGALYFVLLGFSPTISHLLRLLLAGSESQLHKT